MKAASISLDQAKSDKLFYFVANVLIYRPEDRRVLILKRSEREKAHPGKYAFPGGKLEWADMDLEHPTRMNGDVIDFEGAVEDLLARESLEEAGVKIDVSNPLYLNSVAFVRPDGIPVILVKFAAPYVSGEVKVQEGDFTDFAWVNEAEVKEYDCIEGIDEEIRFFNEKHV
ncbi:MAG: NUDIX domain-containing protein [bacterium]